MLSKSKEIRFERKRARPAAPSRRELEVQQRRKMERGACAAGVPTGFVPVPGTYRARRP
jgi:hypothetical protein